jgi:hypothetical protein
MGIVDDVAIKYNFMVFWNISEKTNEVLIQKISGSDMQIADNDRTHFIKG